MFMRELRSFNHYCRRGDDADFYRNRWSYYLKLPEKWRQRLIHKKYRKWLGSVWLRKFLSFIERYAPSDQHVTSWLKAVKPSVIVVSPCNMRFDNEIELVKSGKKLGINTIIPVLSWDNTSTKGLFHIEPTRVFAWHDGHRDDCINYHGISANSIVVTGAPFFDKWFSGVSTASPRQEFCTKVGLDPARPYVLYLGSSANIAKDETWLVRDIEEALRASNVKELQDVQILFRAHPANWQNGLGLLDDGIAVWPREGTLPDSPISFEDFRDSLAHAVCVIGLNTSGMLDAIIADKPVISPLIERYRFTQEKAEHFVRMRDHQTLYITDGVEGVLQRIRDLRKGDDPLKEKRKAFISHFIWPRGKDQTAGRIIAEEIKVIAGGEWHPPKLTVVVTPFKPLSADTDIQAIFSNFKETVEKERTSDLYHFYQVTRDKILDMMNSYKMSAYWFEEVMGFDYLFDASPIIVSKIREHCYHITNERGYNYRQHHAHSAQPFLDRLNALKALDSAGLFVPESEACGGFGHASPDGKINIDTLKYYEVMIGLNKAGFLEPFKHSGGKRRAMVEIGSGWGGFAYQFHTLFPNTTIFCIDLPATMIFSTTYLRGMFPEAKIALYGDMPAEELFARWQEFDFVFIPAHKLDHFTPLQLDLAVNMCSFQEMTTAQVDDYVKRLAGLGCKALYSLNRDRSKHNPELSLVSEIMAKRYALTPITLLPTEYCTVGGKPKPKAVAPDIKHNPFAYRHFAGSLRA